MKKFKRTLWMVTAVFMLMGLFTPGLLVASAQTGNGRSNPNQQINGPYSEDTILVKFNPGTPAQEMRSINAKENLEEVGVIPKIDVRIMKVPADKTVEEIIAILRRNPNIEFVEPDFEAQTMLTPNDPYFANWQGGLKRMEAEAAWELSLGSSANTLTMKNAVDYAYGKGVVLVAAAGNSNTAVFYPAAYPNVIAVAAVDGGDVKASYSNFGPEISVAAPGNTISTVMNGSYGSSSGTSFAAPFVAGLAGLILSEKASLTPAQVQQYIEQGAIDLGAPGFDHYYGYGRINLANSLAFVTNAKPVQPIDVEPPTITLLGESKVTITEGDKYIDAGATAHDEVDGDLTDKIITYNPVTTDQPGTYAITYNVSDAAGNKATEVKRTVVVEPAPVLEPQPTPEPPVEEPEEEQPVEETKREEPVKEEPVEESKPEPATAPQTFSFSGSVDLRKGIETVSHTINISRTGDLDAFLSWNARNADLDLVLIGPDGNQIAISSSATRNSLSEQIQKAITSTGNYTLVVKAVSGKSHYNLKVVVQ